MIDIRFPIGLMFTILGCLLSAYGIFTAGDVLMYTRSLGMNINLYSGLLMLAFGVFMLWKSFAARKKQQQK